MIENAHMPFLDGTGRLWCCRAVTPRCWKLHRQDDAGALIQVATGLPAERVECSPTVLGGALFFTAEVWCERYSCPRFGFFKLAECGTAVELVPQVWSGSVSSRAIALVQDLIHVYDRATGQSYSLDIAEAHDFLRVNFPADRPDELLITLQEQTDKTRVLTVLWEVGSDVVRYVQTTSGADTYKPSLLGDRMIHAARTGAGFEDRSLWEEACQLTTCDWKIIRADESPERFAKIIEALP